VFACPFELVKIYQQVSGSTRSMTEIATKRVREIGVRRGLYQGMALTLMRDMPAFGVYFSSYEISKAKLRSYGYDSYRSSFMSGGIAGVMSFMLLHPIDVFKSCRQMQSVNASGSATTTRAIINAGLDAHGPQFFVRGLVPSILRAGPVSAVIFLVYELVLEVL